MSILKFLQGGFGSLADKLPIEEDLGDLLNVSGTTPAMAKCALNDWGVSPGRQRAILEGDLSVIPEGLSTDMVVANVVIACGTDVRSHGAVVEAAQMMIYDATWEH